VIAALALVLAQAAAPAADPTRPDLTVDQLVDEAVRWLVENQNRDGSWGSHHSPRPIEVPASVPGSQEAFRVATTALCVSALQECPRAGDAGAVAVERATDFLLAHWNDRWYFPAFNLADSAITVGAVLLIADELIRVRRSE